MVDLFDWVKDVEAYVTRIDKLGGIVEDMTKEVKSCADFIQDYIQKGYFGMCCSPWAARVSFVLTNCRSRSANSRIHNFLAN
jgi:hypothetical protein